LIRVERTDFVSVPVQDLERAEQFYGAALGLSKSRGEPGVFAEFETGNLTLQLFVPKAIGREVAPHGGPIALRVPDVAVARAELEDAGVLFDGEIIDSGVCHMALFEDPEGNLLMLHRRYAPFEDGRQP
jgi:predicted enzyme related to lactoylglutathione lyase